eukprot:496171-Pelagomonas_calceolata.AAC.2
MAWGVAGSIAYVLWVLPAQRDAERRKVGAYDVSALESRLERHLDCYVQSALLFNAFGMCTFSFL